MTDVSKKREWQDGIPEWRKLVAPYGCMVEKSPHAYEIAKVLGQGISLVIYPHAQGPTGGWHSARVRNNNSKDKEGARQVIAALQLWCKEDCHLFMYGYQGPKPLPENV